MTENKNVMLEVQDLTIRFGGLVAVNAVNFQVPAGSIFGLIGPNGAGKTTLFNMISGVYAPTSGKVIFNGEEIQGRPPYKVNALGIARTYQNINLFKKMSVLENVMVGCHTKTSSGLLSSMLHTPKQREEERAVIKKCQGILEFMELGDKAELKASSLSYGEQRRLEISRALASEPKMLLLDEPAAGMNGAEKEDLQQTIRKIADKGITVLLVEHDMKLVMNVTLIWEVGWMSKILEVKDLHFHYGEIHALKGISLDVEEGEVVTLIGANGAGKTTTLRALSGLLGRITSGEVWFMGERIDNQKSHVIAAKGLAQCLEGRHVFGNLTVRENLEMGAYLRKDAAAVKKDFDYVFDLFPRLLEREQQRAGTLSGGEQQMLAVGRALMQSPKILMMDEPSLGLAPLVIQDIFSTIKRINADGMPILLIEQNSNAALKVANRGYVIENGEIVLKDSAASLLTNEDVKKAYLGGQ